MPDTATTTTQDEEGFVPMERPLKRSRHGPLATGIFNALSLPGVRSVEDNADVRNRDHIYFDGNANQLHYPRDMFFTEDGLLKLNQRDELNDRSFVSTVGRILEYQGGGGTGGDTTGGDTGGDTGGGGGTGTDGTDVTGSDVFLTVQDVPVTQAEIDTARDDAVQFIRDEVDRMSNRFYVYAGGGYGSNRALSVAAYPSGTDLDYFEPLPPLFRSRQYGLYAINMMSSLQSGAQYSALAITNGSQDPVTYGVAPSDNTDAKYKNDLSKHRRLHVILWSETMNTSAKITVGDTSGAVPDSGTKQFDVVIGTEPTAHYFDLTDIDMSSIAFFFKLDLDTQYSMLTDQRIYVGGIFFDSDSTTDAGPAYTPPFVQEGTGADTKTVYRPLFDKTMIKSWDTDVPDEAFDVIMQNVSFAYDQTLAIVALMSTGKAKDLARAANLVEALLFVIGNDADFDDMRCRNGYRDGPVVPIPEGLTTAQLPGWQPRMAYQNPGDAEKVAVGTIGTYGQDNYVVGTWIGTLAWIAMTLLTFHINVELKLQEEGNLYGMEADDVVEYGPGWDEKDACLTKARGMLDWCAENTLKTDTVGGFTGGFYGGVGFNNGTAEGGPVKLEWRSTEHMADLYASYRMMYAITGEPRYFFLMKHCMRFIDSMWYDGPAPENLKEQVPGMDKVTMYWTGTGPPDDAGVVSTNIYNLPTDPTVWVMYGADRRDEKRVKAMEYIHFWGRELNGDPNSLTKYSILSDGGWIEGSGQVAVAFSELGLYSWQRGVLGACVEHQFPYLGYEKTGNAYNPKPGQADYGGQMYSVSKDSNTGFTLPGEDTKEAWKYYRRGHLGATAWFVIGCYGTNPFKFGAAGERAIDTLHGHANQLARVQDDKMDTSVSELEQTILARLKTFQDNLISHIASNANLSSAMFYVYEPMMWRGYEFRYSFPRYEFPGYPSPIASSTSHDQMRCHVQFYTTNNNVIMNGENSMRFVEFYKGNGSADFDTQTTVAINNQSRRTYFQNINSTSDSYVPFDLQRWWDGSVDTGGVDPASESQLTLAYDPDEGPGHYALFIKRGPTSSGWSADDENLEFVVNPRIVSNGGQHVNNISLQFGFSGTVGSINGSAIKYSLIFKGGAVDKPVVAFDFWRRVPKTINGSNLSIPTPDVLL